MGARVQFSHSGEAQSSRHVAQPLPTSSAGELNHTVSRVVEYSQPLG